MNAYIDQSRSVYGVEPICKVLQITPSAYRPHAARRRDPSRRSQRAQRDEPLTVNIQRVWQENHGVYGVVTITGIGGHDYRNTQIGNLLVLITHRRRIAVACLADTKGLAGQPDRDRTCVDRMLGHLSAQRRRGKPRLCPLERLNERTVCNNNFFMR